MLSENEGREYCMNCGNIQSIPGRSKCDVCGNGDLGIVVTSQIDQDIRDQMERERMGEIEADQAIRDEVMMGIDQALRGESMSHNEVVAEVGSSYQRHAAAF